MTSNISVDELNQLNNAVQCTQSTDANQRRQAEQHFQTIRLDAHTMNLFLSYITSDAQFSEQNRQFVSVIMKNIV